MTTKDGANFLEEWMEVPGFPYYQVSSTGRVRSLARRTASGILGGRLLRLTPGSNGYVRVTLCSEGQEHRFLLHRLVLHTFVGECPEGHECRHLDGNRANCRLSNLCWGTRSENSHDRVRHGTHVNNQGQRHGMTHLKDEDALEIRRLRSSGLPLFEIAQRFSISRATACRISKGNGWNHLDRESAL
jgi:hypothetical protein